MLTKEVMAKPLLIHAGNSRNVSKSDFRIRGSPLRLEDKFSFEDVLSDLYWSISPERKKYH